MRKILLATTVLLVAACDSGTSPTGPTVAPSAPVAAQDRALTIAVDDARERLLPGLSADAAGPVGSALRALAAQLNSPTASRSAVSDALARTRSTVAGFRGPGRADAATLDALRLELDVDQ